MLASLRRIFSTIFLLALLVAGITTIMNFAVNCPIDSVCVGTAIFSTNIDTSQSGSTNQIIFDDSISLAFVNDVVQSSSIYILLISVFLLIALEFKELHYLKILSKRRRQS